MTDSSDEAKQIEKLYEFGERLNEAKDKSQNVKDYEGVIDATKTSLKAKQLAAQLIPRFFKFFPNLSSRALNAHFDLIEEEDLAVRVQAIRGLPLFCKDTKEYISKIVDILGQLLTADEIVERDAVHKALMSVLRQDVKESLTALFKHIWNVEEPSQDDTIRDKVLCFIRDKVFPLKTDLLRPPEEMERHITDLIKKSLGDVTGAEFRMFMDFLKSLSIFGEKAPPERLKELIGIIEGQADLDAQFDVSDADHIDRLISCLFMAIPFFVRGAPGSKFLNYLNKHIIPVFDKLPEERKLDLLKALAEISPYTTPQDSRQVLPSVVQLLKKYMPRRKTGEETNFTYVECLLFSFHHLAHKAPNASNSLCGYKIVTGQPSDRLGEDFSEYYKDFTERLSSVEDLTRATIKKLTQGMAEHNKTMAAAKSDEAKDNIKTLKQNTTTGLRTCNNILVMTKPLHLKTPAFIGDKSVNLSWKEAIKPSALSTTTATGVKRPAAGSGSNNLAIKKGHGAGNMQNQLVNRALEGISYGGSGGRGRGRGWGRRGRGRGYR
ncbi:hypothetical protein ERO13_D06G208800v2 [Gossypium hirsutum]|uniref:Apoptosis inhibitor 5 n=1 Tax=Gossypium hirsutum TaxID=3635 RepID=A0A1U8PP42_GOSHI|nr:apoptosis inhibitor 5-like protein API5 [Gossypium hirsutum]XP_016752010.1 apoptosis inhibitor 5-like protein API5 [Gossypium hirsutum]KAG4143708.1 hypothetical protein ERO13_D06G208800v2 [Gossypium hirsutum]